MAIRALLVEDESRLAENIQKGFEENGYALRHATSCAQALQWLEKGGFDVVILDRMLEGEDGLDLCRRIRADGNNVPILVLSALDGLEDKVTGLDHGADDYLTKPFAFAELLARVRALLRRRVDGPMPGETLRHAGVELDLNHHTATYDGAPLNLTPKEFALLEYFLRHPQKLVNRVALAERVWDKNIELNTNIIDVYITYLRKKLNADGRPNLIHTVRGAGYIFEKR